MIQLTAYFGKPCLPNFSDRKSSWHPVTKENERNRWMTRQIQITSELNLQLYAAIQLSETLTKMDIRHAFIGGFALAALGSMRTTHDIDILIDRSSRHNILGRVARQQRLNNVVSPLPSSAPGASGSNRERCCDALTVWRVRSGGGTTHQNYRTVRPWAVRHVNDRRS